MASSLYLSENTLSNALVTFALNSPDDMFAEGADN